MEDFQQHSQLNIQDFVFDIPTHILVYKHQ